MILSGPTLLLLLSVFLAEVIWRFLPYRKHKYSIKYSIQLFPFKDWLFSDDLKSINNKRIHQEVKQFINIFLYFITQGGIFFPLVDKLVFMTSVKHISVLPKKHEESCLLESNWPQSWRLLWERWWLWDNQLVS